MINLLYTAVNVSLTEHLYMCYVRVSVSEQDYAEEYHQTVLC